MSSDYGTEYIEPINGDDYYEADFEEDFYDQMPQSMPQSWLVGIAILVMGSMILLFVNASIGPLVLAFLFFSLGLVIHIIPGFNDPYARRAFILTFATCVLVMGLAQGYSKFFFDTVQSTVDADTFHTMVKSGVSGETLEELGGLVNAPLPVLVWQKLYSVLLPLGEGPWIGILLNSFLVAMSGSIAVKAGRYVIGDNHCALCRLGTLFACCGMFWLFGAIFIRDSFALFINIVVFWALIRALALPGFKSIIIAVVSLTLCSLCMNYVRAGLLPIFILFVSLALFSWNRRNSISPLTIMLPLVLLFVALMLLPLVSSLTGHVASETTKAATGYGGGQVVTGSLGSSIVVSQPMPIRIPLGSVYLLIQPIPLWNNFHTYMGEYNWIKGCNGIFIVCITPMALVGLGIAIRRTLSGGEMAPPMCFLSFYILVTLMAVAATSLETRHYGQFLPAFLIIASLPDKNDSLMRTKFLFAKLGWFGFVIVGHVIWATIKFF